MLTQPYVFIEWIIVGFTCLEVQVTALSAGAQIGNQPDILEHEEFHLQIMQI